MKEHISLKPILTNVSYFCLGIIYKVTPILMRDNGRHHPGGARVRTSQLLSKS